MSSTRVDLPLPETPVTQMKQPSGNDALTFFRLFALAPRTVSQPSALLPPECESLIGRGATRCLGTAIRARPARYSAVSEFLAAKISANFPWVTISPPRGPAPG